MLGSGDAPVFGGRVAPSQLGEAQGSLLRMALTSRARFVAWVGTRKGIVALIASLTRRYMAKRNLLGVGGWVATPPYSEEVPSSINVVGMPQSLTPLDKTIALCH